MRGTIGASSTNWEPIWNIEFVNKFNEIFNTYPHTPEEIIEKDEYLLQLRKKLTEVFDSKNANAAALAGLLGEEFKKAVWSTEISNNGFNASSVFEFKSIGADAEDIFIKKHGLEGVVEQVTFRNKGKQSMSDWLLTRDIGGKKVTVRVQDKNTTKLFDDLGMLSSNTKEKMKLVRETKLTELRNSLDNYDANLISNEEWEKIGYLVANILWFYSVANDEDYEGANYISSDFLVQRDYISSVLGKGVGYALGIGAGATGEEVITDIVNDINKARVNNNVFFIIGNYMIYPTYLIIDGFIEVIKNEKSNRLDNFKASLVYPTSKNGTAYGSFNDLKIATQRGRLSGPKYDKGAEIINSAKIAGMEVAVSMRSAFDLSEYLK